MELFTNDKETRFFLTDNHVKNLHKIEINNVADALTSGVCGIGVLLRYQYLKVDDLDELIVCNHENDDGSDAYAEGTFHFDFLEWLSFADITQQGLTVGTFTDKIKRLRFIEAHCNADLVPKSKNNSRRYTTPDHSLLFIGVDHEAETIYVSTEQP